MNTALADATMLSPSVAESEAEFEPAHGPHVHVRVGHCDIAIPVAQVRQALPLPPQGLTTLPRLSGGLLGVADADGAAVPIVALERWLPMAVDSDETARPRLLVLQHGGALVGLRVDAVLGVKPVPPQGLRRVHHTPDDDELFESVVPATADHPALCLLEVARLMRLSQAWCADVDMDVSASASARTEPSRHDPSPIGRTRRHALFLIGTEQWAVPVEALERVVPLPDVELALGPGERSWAISEHQGRKLPLVDVSAGSQASTPHDAPRMALLSQGPLCLGLTVSACKQFIDVPDDAVARTPNDEFLAGIAVLPELGKLHVLDPAKLFAVTPEAAISRRTASALAGDAASRAADTADVTEKSPYLVFEADQRYASPVAGIVGVVELPPQAKEDLRTGRRAALAWRGRTVNVVNLPTIAGPARTLDMHLAVLVQGPDEASPPLGIAIRRLSDWLPAHSAKRSGMRMGEVGALNLINAPTSFDNASFIVVDLAQMAYLLG